MDMENSYKILLVEDHQINREMLSLRLVRRGYEVIPAEDGAVACSLAVSEQPDLILMDLSLPVMDGWDATTKIKADDRTADIPIIALTAHAMRGDLEKAISAGCDDYHTKPIELPILLEKIQTLLPAKSPSAEVSPAPEKVTTLRGDNTPQIQTKVKPSYSNVMPVSSNTNSNNTIQASSVNKNPSGNYSGTILVVDDIENNRDILRLHLERCHFKVILAENGYDAIKIIQQQNVELVLLDIMMPGISGLETLKQIRKTHSQAQLPVLMVTAKDESEDMVYAFDLGANDYITKPIDFSVALARIQSHLKTLKASQAKTSAGVSPPVTSSATSPVKFTKSNKEKSNSLSTIATTTTSSRTTNINLSGGSLSKTQSNNRLTKLS